MQTSRLGYRCLVAFVTILLALTSVFPVLDGTKSTYAQEEVVPGVHSPYGLGGEGGTGSSLECPVRRGEP